MKKQCEICKIEITGRSDKRFCSMNCKNKFNNLIRSPKNDIILNIDAILHRNHHILAVLYGKSKTKKIKIPKLVLRRTGFYFSHYTGTYKNNQDKIYHYVYDLCMDGVLYTGGIDRKKVIRVSVAP